MPQWNVAIDPGDADWLVTEATRLKITRSELVRRAIKSYRTNPPAGERAIQNPETKENPVPRAKKSTWNNQSVPKKTKFSKDNPMPPALRVQPPKTVCPRCGTSQWAGQDGLPRPHLRDAVPGDESYTPELVTMTECS